MATTSWILIALVAFTMFFQGEAITCWTCGTATQRECGDAPDTSKLTEVTDCQYCIKDKDIDAFGFHTMSRSCYTSAQVEAMGVSEITIGCKGCTDCGSVKSKCICDSDKCNHATTTVISLATMAFALLMYKLFQ